VDRWNTISRFPDCHAELPGGKPEGGRSLEIDSVRVGPEVVAAVRCAASSAQQATKAIELGLVATLVPARKGSLQVRKHRRRVV
jgi:hypothetical protein